MAIDWEKPLVIDGNPVKLIDDNCNGYKLIKQEILGRGHLLYFCDQKGNVFNMSNMPTGLFVKNAPEKKVFYANIHSSSTPNYRLISVLYSDFSRAVALGKKSGDSYIKTIEVSWEEE